MRRPTVHVFARDPRLGAGKRRLARDAGDVAAWRIARFMAARVIRRITDPRWDVVLRIDPGQSVDVARPGIWPPIRTGGALARIGQGDGDLGARLARAFQAPGPQAVIGLDAPDINAGDIAAAFRGLRRASAVLGPTHDGGFWLMATHGPVPADVFCGVRWSTSHAFNDMSRQLEGRPSVSRSRAPIGHLRRLRDIDTLDDWRAWNGR